MPRVVLLGPPGSGKGTQSEWVAHSLGVPHLSTGDLLRAAVREGTKLGLEADRFMREGRLVPDELVLAILGDRLSMPDCRDGFLLDGFPRNEVQAEALDRIAPIERVLSFEIPESALLERLTGRRSCPKCGTVYNIHTRPPRVADHCDNDGATLVHRSDDHEGAARTRLEVYRRETAPLLAFYAGRHVLFPIDATGAPDEVAARIRRVIG
ncbi:MAG: adenylate kinase [Thermoplasmata archaeon]|nr:adenylate kinase [Thermoplasmata archaeon]MCI4359733.1 adenylate kinase [Thermoplasmata archaeon]